ncbi:L-carnitine/gamma-butyrobetaine antiporter [Clostridium homopropionicum DSM 5847]|uniref:L-carnitine/gamma-butyrobetaine antiporter n=1 Tax=Clostridium homopropionicum DSM 5847 TaxID=1121318 RepID=A0A0L6Z616_9CLOT|nr:BCCT family transporter [Clostridium homopropionicum]KOA18410.1 L-carnitine/gamma-butyrobetaine antiporter [Clostridium homopropionicum DSM 5847]SFF67370.1 betaine/carnitine transporter, BCCT family [Clostridium homopropionicum]
MNKESKIDYALMIPALIITLAISLPLALFKEQGAGIVNKVFAFTTSNFKWAFLIFGLFCVLFLIWLGCSKYGKIKLGGPDDKPEFSTYTWAAMIFCAGIGIAIVYWAFIEPVYYMGGPPFGIEKNSTLAAEWAGALGQFHWGITPWAIYALPTFPIAYAIHVKKIPALKLSTACKGIIGKKADGALGKIIDIIVIFAMVGGVGTSLGLAVPLVTTLVASVLGIQESMTLQLIVLGVSTAVIAGTVWSGLQKGMAALSNLNTYVAYFLLLFVFLLGPTIYILNLWTNSLGILFTNFFRLSLGTDPVANGGFPEAWTVFYWAWWIAYAPMMGLFVARISKGRTIREVVFGELIFGSIGCWIFFAIWGGYAIHIQTTGILDVATIVGKVGTGGTIVAILQTLPAGKVLVLPAFILLCVIFLATTINSAAFTLSSQVTKKIAGDEEPPRVNRTLWAVLLGVFALGLLLAGGLTAVQLSSVVAALPLIPILILMVFSLMKWLKEDYDDVLSSGEVTLTEDKIKPVN